MMSCAMIKFTQQVLGCVVGTRQWALPATAPVSTDASIVRSVFYERCEQCCAVLRPPLGSPPCAATL